jgi:Ser/Thr protein kinase RdoA (MazF antagonist)
MTKQEAIVLCKLFEIYKPTKEPELIEGTHKHKVYKVTTPGNKYAFKEFNLTEPDKENKILLINQGQAIASKFQENDILSICGISENGQYLMELGGSYYLIYPWSEGFVVGSDHIPIAHQAGQLGRLMGHLHKANVKVKGCKKSPPRSIDYQVWLNYKQVLKDQTISDFIDQLQKNIGPINSAVATTSQEQVISHRNLTRSNIIWGSDDKACIIGWGWAGYINPMVELVDTALDWSSGANTATDKEVFQSIIEAYKSVKKTKLANLEEIFYSTIAGKLFWIQTKLDLYTSSQTQTDDTLQEIHDLMAVINSRLESMAMYKGWI